MSLFEVLNNYGYHIVYITTNIVNKKMYVGVHSTNNLSDGYLGSGTLLSKAIKKYGKENFKRETLHFCLTAKDAYYYESLIVDNWFLSRNDTYNITSGGRGGDIWTYLSDTEKKERSNKIKIGQSKMSEESKLNCIERSKRAGKKTFGNLELQKRFAEQRKGKKPKYLKIIIDNIEYKSIRFAVKMTGMSRIQIQKGIDCGIYQTSLFENQKKLRQNEKQRIKFCLITKSNDILYFSSITEASIKLNIGYTSLQCQIKRNNEIPMKKGPLKGCIFKKI